MFRRYICTRMRMYMQTATCNYFDMYLYIYIYIYALTHVSVSVRQGSASLFLRSSGMPAAGNNQALLIRALNHGH